MFIFGRAHNDVKVLRVGSAIEKIMNMKERLAPYMLPKTDLTTVMGS